MRRFITISLVAVATSASAFASADESTAATAPPPSTTAAESSKDSSASTQKQEQEQEQEREQSAPLSSSSPSIFLHIASSQTVTLARDDTGEIVCTSPCDQKVPESVRYRIVGDRGPSTPFVLTTGEGGRSALNVKAASNTKFWFGVSALGLSAGLIAGGVATLLYGVAHRAAIPGADGETTDNSFTNLMTAGSSLLLVGTVAGIWGGATVVANRRTKVRGNVQEVGAPPPSSSSTSRAGIALPSPTFVFSVPLLRGTF